MMDANDASLLNRWLLLGEMMRDSRLIRVIPSSRTAFCAKWFPTDSMSRVPRNCRSVPVTESAAAAVIGKGETPNATTTSKTASDRSRCR